MQLLRLLTRSKNNPKLEDQRIIIRIHDRSQEFFLEDGFENRTVHEIKEAHGYTDKNIVLLTLKGKKILGKRALFEFEILSFVVQQAKFKGHDIILYFSDK